MSPKSFFYYQPAAPPTQDDFITRWDTTLGNGSNTLTIPVHGLGGVDFSVNWGDGSPVENYDSAIVELTHTYSSSGVYDLTIAGTMFSGFAMSSSAAGNREKLIDIIQWGTIPSLLRTNFFRDCTGLTVLTATDTPNLTNITALDYMFAGCSNFNSPLDNWQTFSVSNFFSMFDGCSSFNSSLDQLVRASGFSLQKMFKGTAITNQNFNSWNTRNVRIFAEMFQDCRDFNGVIGGWDTGQGTNFSGMFWSASIFNDNISGWDMRRAENCRAMLGNARAFNQNISGWLFENVNDMDLMFFDAREFNQDLSGWCVDLIPTEPSNFDSGATNWVLPRPVWGTCP